MTSKERIIRVLEHKIPDRVPIQDSVWKATVRRWHKEGLPEDMEPQEYFDYEMEMFLPDVSPRLPVKILEHNEEYMVSTTPFGGKIRNHKDYSTTPEIIDWPVKKKDDWKELKKLLAPDMARVDWASGLSRNKTASDKGKFNCFSCACGYDALQNYMKSEQILTSMAEDPEWIKEMITTNAELIIVTAELMIKNGFKLDGAFLYNDMGYRNGLLFSPEMYKKTHYDADKLLYEYFHSKGMKVILHSCGNVSEIIPVLIELGLDCIQPIEVKAGMDLKALKEKYGDSISLMGGIDVRTMAENDPEKIEETVKTNFEIAKKNGGYIYHSDHSIPKNISFQQYCRVMEAVKKYGVYAEYDEQAVKDEGAKTPAPEQTESKPEKVKKSRFGLGKKKEGKAVPAKNAPTKPEAPKPAVPVKKQGKTGEAPGKQEKKEGKKFKLPFGKK